jgi:thioredoxin-related protein
MRRRLALLLLLVFSLAAHAARAEELVMFERPGCVYCERWHREVGPAYENSEEGRKAPLKRVDLSLGMPKKLEALGKVRFTPTFVVMSCGQEKGRILGYPGENQFWGLLDRILETPSSC